MSKWAIDFGTTNTRIARWNEREGLPEMIRMEGVCRDAWESAEIDVQNAVPSCVLPLPKKSLADRVGSWPLFQRLFFLGRQALIGREALEKDYRPYSRSFISCWKPHLLRGDKQALGSDGRRTWTAEQAAGLFLRELLARVTRTTGERPRDMVWTVPVDSYEPYRARLKTLAARYGITRFRLIDEPVAAAIGYSLRIDEPQYALVTDFGGGTFDLALVEIGEKISKKGRCRVVAKAGAALGGSLVDAWLVEKFAAVRGYELSRHIANPEFSLWYRAMLEEACRVKEGLYFRPRETFCMLPPSEYQRFEARVTYGKKLMESPIDFSRDSLVALLEERGFYRQIDALLDETLRQARKAGIADSAVREVLMVGGSTLLPGVYARFEQRFGRSAVRAWQPFEAVAYGACAFAAGHFTEADFIVHDYAFVTYNKKTHEPEYNVIVPHSTPFPTGPDFWKRRLVPTCPLGVPERQFKLEICEIGKRRSADQEFIWDEKGQLHSLKNAKDAVIIPLNQANPVLGDLNPAHKPSDRSARLEISFMVDDNRWLCVTVFDLKTRQYLKRGAAVLRLA